MIRIPDGTGEGRQVVLKREFLTYLNKRKGTFQMKNMSRYCKAYAVEKLSAYPRWNELAHNDLDKKQSAEQEYFFLHDNFVVTKDVFVDEDVVFDAISDEWREFCTSALDFQVPEEVQAIAANA
jgi:hypothetical protein